MKNAHRGLGYIALLSGFAAVLVLSGFFLIRGAPGRTATPPPPVREPGPEVEELVGNGEVIPAIKRYRELYGVGLKEAKDAVDHIRARLRDGRP